MTTYHRRHVRNGEVCTSLLCPREHAFPKHRGEWNVLHDGPSSHVPRHSTEGPHPQLTHAEPMPDAWHHPGRVTEAADGSWVCDKRGAAS